MGVHLARSQRGDDRSGAVEDAELNTDPGEVPQLGRSPVVTAGSWNQDHNLLCPGCDTSSDGFFVGRGRLAVEAKLQEVLQYEIAMGAQLS